MVETQQGQQLVGLAFIGAYLLEVLVKVMRLKYIEAAVMILLTTLKL